MSFKLLLVSIGVVSILACDPEPTGPETNCDLRSSYKLDHGFLKASRAFDVRTDPPTELINGRIEYALFYQYFFHRDDVPLPFPYSEYFIDSIAFIDPSLVHVAGKAFERIYDYERNDCQIELESPEGNLHLELTEGGEEIAETRFAIFDHKSRRVTIDTLSFISDTFIFLEFRLGPFASYEEIIRQFALDNPGQFDTIAIEQVQNRTKE